MTTFSIRRLSTLTTESIHGLGQVLIDCVEGGASVGFVSPMTLDKANAFWTRVAQQVELKNRILLVAESHQGKILGTAQVILDLPENQSHRADIAKMLVHREARQLGVGRALLRAAEEAALEQGRNVLVLDTVTGSPAEQMYQKSGWRICGQIPDYAVMPDGKLCSTTYMYKMLS